jgi:hypothetical protein
MQLTIASAQRDYGRVSMGNTKMPGTTFAVSATKCNVGGKLAQIKGSTCHKCYALKLERLRPSVAMGWSSNYMKATRMIAEQPEQWAKGMAFQITKLAEKTGELYHRWFDGGDLASLSMLEAIVLVAKLTPTIKHWLPTREAAIVKAFLAKNTFPTNLIVRISSTMVDDKPIAGHEYTSTVHSKGAAHAGQACEARSRGNQCGPCRACWDHRVANVSYPLHH